MRKIFSLIAISIFYIDGSSQPTDLEITYSTLPDINGFDNPDDVLYAADIEYGTDEPNRQAFDLYLPGDGNNYPLALFIHGGGFTGKNRKDNLITREAPDFINKGVAFISLGYRLMKPNDSEGNVVETDGIRKSLYDARRGLQFIRYYADDLKIDPNNIVMGGRSAGAGTVTWISMQNDFADPTASDLISRESTRVKAVGLIIPQATYDLVSWHEDVYYQWKLDHESEGFTLDYLFELGESNFQRTFPGATPELITSDQYWIDYRNEVHLLEMISEDDPPVYIRNSVSFDDWDEEFDVLHHPWHSERIYDTCLANNVEVKANILNLDGYSIDNTEDESLNEFLYRYLSVSNIWTAAGGTNDWNTPENWSENSIPTATTNVLIPYTDFNPEINEGQIGGCNDITIEKNASLTVNSGGAFAIGGKPYVSGTYTAEKFVNGNGGYSILGSPVLEENISTLSSAESIYSFDNSNDSYNIITSGTIKSGVGYFVSHAEPNPLVSFSGIPSSGTIRYTYSASDGYELVANPYGCAINVARFLEDNDNISAAYLWSDGGVNSNGQRIGDYVTLNITGGVVNNPAGQDDNDFNAEIFDEFNITSIQGFFVDIIDNSNTEIVFKTNHQVLNRSVNITSNHYRNSEFGKLKLAVKGTNNYNEILIGLNNNTTLGVDRMYDAKKNEGNSNFSFYSFIDNMKYAIQTVPNSVEKVLLGYNIQTPGSYELSVVSLQGIYHHIYLKDNYYNTEVELNNNTTIRFEITNSIRENDRFELRFLPNEILTLDETPTELKISGYKHELVIESPDSGHQNVSIFSLTGKLIYEDNVNFKNNMAVIRPDLSPKNIYLIQVSRYNTKFFLK